MSKKIPREIRFCECGCGGSFECRTNSEQRFLPKHYAKTNKKPREIRYCVCGCGFSKEVQLTSTWKFKHGHGGLQFGKGQVQWNIGLTKETDLRIAKLAEKMSGENNHMFGKHHSEATKQLMHNVRAGKTVEEMGHPKDCLCCACRNKRGEYKKETHPSYVDGHTFKDENGQPVNLAGVIWSERRKREQKKDYRENIGYWRLMSQKNHALAKKGGILSIEIIQRVYEDNVKKYGTLTCYLCEKPIDFGKDCLEHKIPLSRGGTHDYDNLGIAHGSCNNKKSKKTDIEYKQYLLKGRD